MANIILKNPEGIANTYSDIAELKVPNTGGEKSSFISPEGTINISGIDVINVTNYARAQVVDTNLKAENIKKDVNVLGIIGTCEGTEPTGNINVTPLTTLQQINVAPYATATVAPMPTGSLGSILATKVISNNAATVTPYMTSGTAGYNTMAAKDGTPITVAASELVSGNKGITATTATQTGINVTNYATVSVAPTPSETKSVTTNGDVTPTSGKLLSKVTVNVPTGTARSSSDLTVSGKTVSVPAGLYSSAASKSVAVGTITGSGSKQQSAPTFSKSGDVITASVAATSGTITPSVSTAGYVSSSEGTKTNGTFTMSANSATYTIPTETKTATTNGTVTPTSGKYLTSVTVAIPVYNGEVS